MNARCDRCGAGFHRDHADDWKRLCLPCWREANAKTTATRRTPRAVVPAEMLPRLIRLCHPDRHGNSEASTIATQWLLSLRPGGAR